MTEEKNTPKTPEEIEKNWYENTYQGDNMRQLTFRAILMGMILGCIMSLSNLYVGLKAGWGLGVAITACILSYAIYSSLLKLFPKLFKTNMSILENNCMQSTASSAGYSTGGTMVSAVSAYLIITNCHIPFWTLTGWTFFLAMLGVMMAIPMKRQMINIEQLKFPSGIAAAETLKSLHSRGEEAMKKAKSLGISGLIGALVAWFRDGKVAWMSKLNIPGMLDFPFKIGGVNAIKYTFGLEMSLILVAAGAITGIRTTTSMLIGSIINYGILAPWMYKIGAIKDLGYRAIVSWSLWMGASLMVTSGLFTFFSQWKTIARSFSAITKIFVKNKTAEIDPLEKIEVPGSWFLSGILIAGLGSILLQKYAFNISVWMGIIAVILSFFLAIVACRATGETDITPVGAMGKITQLTYGIIAPSNMTTNLMTASVTAASAGSAADLLTDLKSGYLLGANPRLQFLAQFFGVFAGTLVVVPAFYLLVPNASILGSDKFPAPAAQVWAGVAKILSTGFSSLHPTAQLGLLIGCMLGIILPALELLFPKNKKYIPSSMGLGLALVLPAWNSISMFIGALISTIYAKINQKAADDYVIPVSSGLIAGESLMGILIAMLVIAGLIQA